MESFYGGKHGQSFIIVQTYKSINEMSRDFANGRQCKVHYGEYVLIDSDNRNNQENGLIFKRTTDEASQFTLLYMNGTTHTFDTKGAEYIGAIQGPAGPAPTFDIIDYNNIDKKVANSADSDLKRNGSVELSFSKNTLIPGKDGNTFNDNMSIKYCSITKADGSITEAYIGFKIPYLVTEFELNSISAYKDIDLKRVDDKQHPFYQRYSLEIPKNKKGNYYDNFRFLSANEVSDSSLLTSYLQYLSKFNNIYNKDREFTEEFKETKEYKYYLMLSRAAAGEASNKILCCNFHDFSESEEGTIFSVVVGEVVDIKNISLVDNGATLVFDYTDGTSKRFNAAIKSIKDVDLADDGTLTFTYNSGEQEVANNKLKWINDLKLDNNTLEDTQKLIVTYNNGASAEIGNAINTIYKLAIDPVTFHLIALYSDPEVRKSIPENAKVTYEGRNDWQDLGSIKSDNGILIAFNIEPSEVTKYDITNTDGALKYLNETYKDGLQDALKGKIVTIGKVDSDEKRFYAFDYRTNHNASSSNLYKGWYYLGKINGAKIPSIMFAAPIDDPDLQSKKDALEVGGIWFVLDGIASGVDHETGQNIPNGDDLFY